MQRKEVVITTFGLAIALSLGVIIGWFSKGDQKAPEPTTPSSSKLDWQQILINNINADNIRSYLRELTRQPHLAGTEENKKLAEDIVSRWKDWGFDSAELVKYDVLLSYPGGENNRNRAIIKELNGTTLHTTALEEKILDPEQNNSKVVPPFNAYTKGGPPVTSRFLYYVNYGRAEDFEYLARTLNINLTGSIVIARYGQIFRGNKVRLAQEYGAVGVLLYSDPYDNAYGINSTYESTFPNSWWLPPSGAQRGSTFLGNGDPLTPGYPAKNGAYRLTVESLRQSGDIPDIPSHPIGYEDAAAFLKILPGSKVNDASWAGDLNLTYRYGGLLLNCTVELRVNNTERMATIYDAIGVIRGETEPDRYVLLGNHRDAWIFGSVDPSSGTASMLEVSRSFGELMKSGWRPRRTLVFCSWGAEEYGLIGSNEWVEEFTKVIDERAVAYINVDSAVAYNYVLLAKGSPLLHKALYEAAKSVPDPEAPKFKTIFDSWLNRMPSNGYNKMPMILVPGSGSDHASFYQKVGVPSLDLVYIFDQKKWPLTGYPLYHSVYETYELMEKFIDPTFKWHQAMSRLWAVLARSLADAALLPLDPVDYGSAMQHHFEAFKSTHNETLQRVNVSAELNRIESAISTFAERAAAFVKKNQQDTSSLQNPYELRRANDQLMQLERAFIDPAGLLDNPQTKHLLYSQGTRDRYDGAAFPGMADALYGILYKNGTALTSAVEETKREMARVLFAIESATLTIEDVTSLHR